MPLLRLEHYLVLSDDIDGTRDFYCDVLGMREGFRPKLGFAGYWLYVGDVPSIHIAEWESYAVWTKEVGIPISSRAKSTGAVDHIAFNGEDFDAILARLQQHGVSAHVNHVSGGGLRQLFLLDPNGIKIEINVPAKPSVSLPTR